MALIHTLYTAPEKVQGDLWTSEEHNEIKLVVNSKPDTENTILIEGNQEIDGNLTMLEVIGTTGRFESKIIITNSTNQILNVSARTDGNTALDRSTYLRTSADDALDFQVYSSTDAQEKFSVDTDGKGVFADGLEVNGTLDIFHALNTTALKLSSKTLGGTTDIVFEKLNKIGGRIRMDENYDIFFQSLSGSNVLKKKISIGSQRGTGLSNGVTLHHGENETISLYTEESSIVIPVSGGSTGVHISSKTSDGVAGTVESANGSVFFKKVSNSTSGVSLEFIGDNDRFYLNRFDGAESPVNVLSVHSKSSNVEIYGNLITNQSYSGTVYSNTLYRSYGADSAGGFEGSLGVAGTLVVGSGNAPATTMASVGKIQISSLVENKLYLVSDTSVEIISNLSSIGKTMIYDASGHLTLPENGIVYAANFQISSDMALKEEVYPLDVIKNIDFIKFKFKGSDIQRYGVSAQEVQKVAPELVSEDKNGNLTVAMMDLLVLKIAELEKKINSLTE